MSFRFRAPADAVKFLHTLNRNLARRNFVGVRLIAMVFVCRKLTRVCLDVISFSCLADAVKFLHAPNGSLVHKYRGGSFTCHGMCVRKINARVLYFISFSRLTDAVKCLHAPNWVDAQIVGGGPFTPDLGPRTQQRLLTQAFLLARRALPMRSLYMYVCHSIYSNTAHPCLPYSPAADLPVAREGQMAASPLNGV